MKNTLLITTAIVALVAGANLASAQHPDEQRGAPATTGQKAPAAGQKAPTVGQKAPKGKMAKQNTNTGQKSEAAKPYDQAPGTQAGNATDSKSVTQKDETRPPGVNSSVNSSVGAQAESKSGASKPLSAEQRAKIHASLQGEDRERLTRGSFSTSVGAAIPRTVHLNKFPAQFVESFPEYREYEYVLVGDDILIVDPHTLQIIAVIPA